MSETINEAVDDTVDAAHKAQVVVITGASAGIGRATAIRFAQDGAKIALLARGRAGLEGAKRDVEAAGGQALIIPTDVSDAEAVEAAAQRVEDELGPIDVWINSAMCSVFSPVKEMTPEEYRRVTEVTYLGYVYGTLAALKRMLPRDRGAIVQVGSALAYRGIPLQSAYCGAKHAIQGFCDSLRTELMHDKSNVHLTMVQLSAFNTPQFEWVQSRLPGRAQPVPPIYQPEIAAEGIHWAALHERRELIIGFPSVRAIIGNKIVPEFADWVLSRMGYKSQQTSEPEDPQRPHNLWQPVDDERDFGTHGRFDEQSRTVSPQLFGTTHRRLLTLIGAGLAAAGLVSLLGKRNDS
ncbi:MAG: SDR family oxidoreductase [Armatimonadetes bacterium]|nr:SDR family oxidoreductase [Armatimonadota bacterium]